MKRFGIIFLGACMLQACQTREDLAPVYNGRQVQSGHHYPEHEHTTTTVEVMPGETLSTIAKRFNLDYHHLAAMNHIDPPYTIHAGQILMVSKHPHVSALPVEETDAPEFVYENPAPKMMTHSAATTAKSTTPAHNTVPLPVATSSDWIWPVKEGYVAKPYLSRVKGMEIGVTTTQPVLAARAGTVVYAGVDVSGSGQLIIIRHPGGFLTAYSHETGLLVKEGEQVKMGQKIASIKPSKKTFLHFEVRKSGKTVDPTEYVTAKG